MDAKKLFDELLAQQYPEKPVADAMSRVSMAGGSARDREVTDHAAFIFDLLSDETDLTQSTMCPDDLVKIEITDSIAGAIRAQFTEAMASMAARGEEEEGTPEFKGNAPLLSEGEQRTCEELASRVSFPVDLQQQFMDAYGKSDFRSLLHMTRCDADIRGTILKALYNACTLRERMEIDADAMDTMSAMLSERMRETADVLWDANAHIRMLKPGEFISSRGGVDVYIDFDDAQAFVLYDKFSDGFVFHYHGAKVEKLPYEERKDLRRLYVTIDPAFANDIGTHFLHICARLRAVGVMAQTAKAIHPLIVPARFDNMMFVIKPADAERAQEIIGAYLRENGIGRDSHPAAAATDVPGLSVAREPDAHEQAYGQFIHGKAGKISYSQYLCAHALPLVLDRLIASSGCLPEFRLALERERKRCISVGHST